MTYLGLDEGRLLAIVDALNRIAGALPGVEDVADAGASAALSLTSATGASVDVVDPARVRSYQVGDATDAGSHLTLPLQNGDLKVGSITLVKRSDEGFDEASVEAIRLVADGLGAQLDQALRHELTVTESRVDPLTGLGNRLAFEERLGWELSRSSRYAEKLSLAVFEIDDFTGLQARLGHEDTDRLIEEVAEALSQGRSADSCFRLESDSFAVVMPNTPKAGAEIAAIRMVWQIAISRGGDIVTATTGVAQADVPDPRVLLAAAHESLRAARLAVSA